MSENEGVFWENAKGLRADTALSPLGDFWNFCFPYSSTPMFFCSSRPCFSQ